MSRYTKKDINDADRLISDSVAEAIERQVRAISVYRPMYASSEPLPRRTLIRIRLLGARDRIEHAIAALRGRDDCGCDW